jgi:hypothetical protein
MQRCVALTSEFGIVVRRAALMERGVSWEGLLNALDVPAPLDSNNCLISFGPHFGQEAVDILLGRLSGLGLKYFDDFFEFHGDYPKWCAFRASSPDERSDIREQRGHSQPL